PALGRLLRLLRGPGQRLHLLGHRREPNPFVVVHRDQQLHRGALHRRGWRRRRQRRRHLVAAAEFR
ncbi:MAG: hypothetical protein ACK55I_07250, partial [bacterium]